MLTKKAYAKINLTLEVLGKRSDGYHQITSVMQAVDLCDTLTFEPAPDVTLACNVRELESPDNLCLRAAHLLRKATGYSGGVTVQLTKRIPIAAGLGGGSSDAAATLLALNELWQLRLSKEKLLSLARELGSDVSFFLYGGTTLAEGKGEKITPLPPCPDLWVVLLKPPFSIPQKTARLFSSISTSNYAQGQATRAMTEALRKGAKDFPQLLFNTFDTVAPKVFMGLEEYCRLFLQAGAPFVHLCGTGPTLFTLIQEEAEARKIHSALASKWAETYLCRTRRG